MKYQVVSPFTIRTPQGLMELAAGQNVIIPAHKAMSLVEAGRIRPGDIADHEDFFSGLTEDERYIFEERAGIMEYDGGLPRDEAERLAKVIFLEKYREGRRG